PDIPPALAGVVETALAKEPSARFGNVISLGHALVEASRAAVEQTSLLGLPQHAAPVTRRYHSPAADDDMEIERLGGWQQPPAPPPSAQARRKHPRVPFVTPVRLVLRDGGTIDGRSEDISEGGLLVVVNGATPGDHGRVNVRFALPLTGRIVQIPAQ